ncbi:hypothetical protein [Streptomyces sp. NRRL S-340]
MVQSSAHRIGAGGAVARDGLLHEDDLETFKLPALTGKGAG